MLILDTSQQRGQRSEAIGVVHAIEENLSTVHSRAHSDGFA
jgi:hypothetical protein